MVNQDYLDQQFDFVVIGGGSGGVRFARKASEYGAKVALVERDRLGGTCVIRGCVPKKYHVIAAKLNNALADAVSYGYKVDYDVANFEYSKFVEKLNTEIGRLEGIYDDLLKASGVVTIRDEAVIRKDGRIWLTQSNALLNSDKVVVAAGGAPMWPKIEGAQYAMTSDEFFINKRKLKSVIVVGGGYTALELAGSMAGMGVEVKLFFRSVVLRDFDLDIQNIVVQGMKNRGVAFFQGTLPTRIEKKGDGLLVHTEKGEFPCDEMLFAIGRKPETARLFGHKNSDDEKVERSLNTPLEIDKGGALVVNSDFQTSNPNVYAIGDVINRVTLTPVAIAEAEWLAKKLLKPNLLRKDELNNKKGIDYELIPTAVFSQPEIGTCGLSEQQAVDRYAGKVKIYKSKFVPLQSKLAAMPEESLVKIITLRQNNDADDPETEKVIGIHLVAESASDMIQCLAVAMKMGATKADLDRTMALHPCFAEEIVTIK